EDTSKRGRIDAINVDEEITLVSVQNVDEEMFDVNVLDGEEVFVAEEEVVVKDVNNEVNVVEEVVEVINSSKLITYAAQVSVAGNVVSIAGDATTVSAATTNTAIIITVDDVTLAQALVEIKSTKTKEKGVVIQELGESTTTISSQLSSQQSHDKGKEKRAGTELIQENAKKQKVEDDKEIAELKQCLEIIPDEEEVTIDDIPLAVKSPTKYESTRPVDDLDLLLWGDLKTMFEPHVEDKVWRNHQEYKVLDWKLYVSYGVHSLRMQHMQIYMLVEKKYPLAPLTLSVMLEKKLIIDYESKMAYQLLKFIIKQLKK
ncbi:hypothetical protein Tco_0164215, partial [Tanacetum coccineum]